MREHVSQSKKATTASFSIPSLKHRIPGFGSDSSQASPQAVPLVQPVHKPLTHDISRIPLRNPQAKLSISQPGDKYEQEADSVAQQVMQRIVQPVNRQSIQREALPQESELQMKPLANSITPLQRQEMPESEEELQMKSLDNSTLQRQQAPEEEEELQMKSMVQRQAGMAAAPDLETSINQARGGGQAMADNIRHPMEVAFGTDFSGVKVHTDGQSDQLNRSIQARAFTTGQDVFFRQGEYNPGNRGGQELLAHELTHVVQQNGGAVQRSPLSPQQLLQHPAIKNSGASGGDRMVQAMYGVPTTTPIPEKLEYESSTRGTTCAMVLLTATQMATVAERTFASGGNLHAEEKAIHYLQSLVDAGNLVPQNVPGTKDYIVYLNVSKSPCSSTSTPATRTDGAQGCTESLTQLNTQGLRSSQGGPFVTFDVQIAATKPYQPSVIGGKEASTNTYNSFGGGGAGGGTYGFVR